MLFGKGDIATLFLDVEQSTTGYSAIVMVGLWSSLSLFVPQPIRDIDMAIDKNSDLVFIVILFGTKVRHYPHIIATFANEKTFPWQKSQKTSEAR